MASVSLKNLFKNYGSGAAAVKDLSLEIRDGEFVALLGPSGCGKSTTLRMIAGLETPTGGSIHFGQEDVTFSLPAERNIAMVFQNYALYPHMTVRENLEYPLRKRGVAKEGRGKLCDDVAELLQITALLERRPAQLSGGQQQRVALGRALIRNPAVFLLDEPLSNLDAKLRTHMRAELVQLHRRVQTTMIYVTHDQLEAMTMADRIAVVFEGELQQFATPDEVYNRPCNKAVAGFIGTPMINFMDATISPGPAGPQLMVEGQPASSLPEAFNSLSGRPLTLGIRPEDVLDTSALPGDSLVAKVVLTEPVGHETLVTLDVGRTRMIIRHHPDSRFAPGTDLRLRFNPQKLHFFDPSSGQRLEAGA